MAARFENSMFVESGADIEGDYRYTLFRRWGSGRSVCWLMLNPSTADAEQLDPTLRRCARYTEDWGYERFDVVNLFAYRSTDPDVLPTLLDPIGYRNDEAIVKTASQAGLVVCGWGVGGALKQRDLHVLKLLKGVTLTVLRLTAEGHPHHPLYLPKSLKPTVWRAAK